MHQTKYADYIRRCTVSKLLQERWMRLAFAPNSTTVRIDEADEAHKNSKIYDDCWDGYVKVAGKERGEPGSCEKQTESDEALQETENNLWDNIRKAQEKPKSQRNHPNSKEYQSAKKAAKEINKESDETLEETDENLAYKIAKEIIADPDVEEVEVDGEVFPVEMTPASAEEITGEKIQEAIANWYRMINEDGFDKEKKDKMKCNDERYLRDGEPGHGEKQKVVKACDPGSDKEKIIKFGDANMKNKSNVDSNRESFRARHNCKDKTLKKDWDTASYWACKDW